MLSLCCYQFLYVVIYNNCLSFSRKLLNRFIGIGNNIVDSFSEAVLITDCMYLNCRAIGVEWMISAASLRANDDFFSPSAAINCNIKYWSKTQTKWFCWWYLCSCFSRCFSFSCHWSLQIWRQTNVFSIFELRNN